jgi:hypothetical protein
VTLLKFFLSPAILRILFVLFSGIKIGLFSLLLCCNTLVGFSRATAGRSHASHSSSSHGVEPGPARPFLHSRSLEPLLWSQLKSSMEAIEVWRCSHADEAHKYVRDYYDNDYLLRNVCRGETKHQCVEKSAECSQSLRTLSKNRYDAAASLFFASPQVMHCGADKNRRLEGSCKTSLVWVATLC